MGLFNFLKKKKTERPESSYQFLETGFHGDQHLLKIVDFLMSQNVEVFIETGTNVGTTLAYVGKKHPKVNCYSCEPDLKAYSLAKQNSSAYPNINIFNLMSQDFIKKLKKEHSQLFNKKALFWLDAHSYGFDWPLKEEVNFVAKNFPNAYLMIDDFKVPNMPMFNYDRYKDQLCAHEFIVNELRQKPYQLFYPGYTEKTSTHHPLQGWGLYVFGEKINFTEDISKLVKLETK